jgi:hypothetical protein
VRGAGAQTCATYTTILEEQRPETSLFLAWIEGYITGHNRLAEDTFDILPLLSPGEVAVLVRNVCRNDPDLRIETALARLLNMFAPYRVRRASEIMTVTIGDKTVSIRGETLRQAQEKLHEKGHYRMAPDGIFGPGTQAALRRYQEAEGLQQTGVPDADTLVRLFFRREQ